jgi:hypothetical protein
LGDLQRHFAIFALYGFRGITLLAQLCFEDQNEEFAGGVKAKTQN